MPVLTAENFKSLEDILANSCGALDARLLARAINDAGVDIKKVTFDKEKRQIIINGLTPNLVLELKNSLAKSQADSCTGRLFELSDSKDGNVVISANKFQSAPLITHDVTTRLQTQQTQKRLSKDDKSDLSLLHQALIVKLKEDLEAGRSVDLLIGEEHETLKSYEAHLMLLFAISDAGLSVDKIVLELPEYMLPGLQKSGDSFVMKMTKVAEKIFGATINPALKKIYSNEESKFIEADLASSIQHPALASMQQSKTAGIITLAFVGLNHLVPVEDLLYKSSTMSSILLNHAFVNPQEYEDHQRRLIKLTKMKCFRIATRNKLDM